MKVLRDALVPYRTVLAASAIIPASATAHAETSLFIEAETLSFSESTALLDLDDFNTGFDASGDLSISYSKVVTGVEYGRFEVSAFARADGDADYSPNTAEIYREIANRLPISRGEYDIDIAVDYFLAYGLRFGYTQPIGDNFELTGHVNLLRGFDTTEGSLRGNFVVTDVINSNLDLDYYYSREVFGIPFFMNEKPEEPEGNGLSFDLEAKWTPSDKLLIELDIDDIWGEIDWGDTPRSTVVVDTSGNQINDDGSVTVNTTFGGQNLVEKHTQTIDPRGSLTGTYRALDKVSIHAEINRAPSDHTFYVGGADYHFSDNLSLGGRVEATTGSFGVSANLWGLSLDVVTDSFSPEEAKFARIQAGLRFTF